GDLIDAQMALEIGLDTRVVPPETLLDEAMALARRIAVNSGPALRMAKRLMRQAQTARLDETLQLSAALQALAHNTDEHHASVKAFFDDKKK
ncbi:MAG: enoyl-CoA hydratase-related protein, partial [Burkholderiaceae bacterium]